MDNTQKYIEHLQAMVRIPTVSHDDDSLTDYAAFDRLHACLEEMYPLVHRRMERISIGRAGLLFYLKSSHPSGKLPVLLMAHQDVVPEGPLEAWTHAPYSGDIADGCLWGRGSTDCKYLLMGELEAVESLLAEGFDPDYDLYLAFAHNEEVQSTEKGAALTVQYLQQQGVTLGAVFDEGSSMRRAEYEGKPFYLCQINLGEKAYQDYEIYCECAGGHSMAPGSGTGLGKVARAIVAIEETPLPYRLTDIVRSYLRAMAPFQPKPLGDWYAEPDRYFAQLCEAAKQDKTLDSLLHTTCAVTMASGSSQANLLPARASAIMNCRVLEGDTVESLLEHFRSLMPQGVQVRLLHGGDPSPVRSLGGRCLQLVEEIEQERSGGRSAIIPGLLAGGTDSRYYAPICENVFRYSGYLRDERWGLPHAVNERIPCDSLHQGVDFFRAFLTRY